MRNIKFRVWDNSKMINNPIIAFGEHGWGIKDVPKGDAQLMQFTGLTKPKR